MLSKDGKFYDVVCDTEEDIVGNIRVICSDCKSEISLVMSLLYNNEHNISRIEKCTHCGKLNLVWDKTLSRVNS